MLNYEHMYYHQFSELTRYFGLGGGGVGSELILAQSDEFFSFLMRLSPTQDQIFILRERSSPAIADVDDVRQKSYIEQSA